MLRKFCAKSGCKKLTENKYCQDHDHLLSEDKAERNRLYDRHARNQDAKKFYNSREWLAARAERLRLDKGLCQQCLKKKRITTADMVHHKKPISSHWELRLDISHMESLCNSCHSAIDHAALEAALEKENRHK